MIFKKRHDVTKKIMSGINRVFINVKKLTLKKKSCYEFRKNRTFYYESNRIKQNLYDRAGLYGKTNLYDKTGLYDKADLYDKARSLR